MEPARTIVPVPSFVKANAPLIAPLTVKSVAAVPSLATVKTLVVLNAILADILAPLLPVVVLTVKFPASVNMPVVPVIEAPVGPISIIRPVGPRLGPKLNAPRSRTLPALTVKLALLATAVIVEEREKWNSE